MAPGRGSRWPQKIGSRSASARRRRPAPSQRRCASRPREPGGEVDDVHRQTAGLPLRPTMSKARTTARLSANQSRPHPGARSCGHALAVHHRDLSPVKLGRQSPDRGRQFLSPLRLGELALAFKVAELIGDLDHRGRPGLADRWTGGSPGLCRPLAGDVSAAPAAEFCGLSRPGRQWLRALGARPPTRPGLPRRQLSLPLGSVLDVGLAVDEADAADHVAEAGRAVQPAPAALGTQAEPEDQGQRRPT